MLTRFIRMQLIVFAVLTLAALVALGWYYLRIPSQLGVGQYRLVAELPASGGSVSHVECDLPRDPDRQGHQGRADEKWCPGDA